MNNQLLKPRLKPVRRGRSFVGFCCRLLLWIFPLLAIALVSFLAAFVLFPPFGSETTARVLLVGLDAKEDGVQRSDTIILMAARLDGSSTTLVSVPRDSRVRIPGSRRGITKINAAYASGKEEKLKETLAQPDVMGADLPYHIVFDSNTVAKVIDAMGGIELDVPRDMNYDDNWGKLHIHLKKGRQHLNGEQVVGYLRWRKNSHGRGSSDDFSRTERQRTLFIAIKDKMRTWDGVKRVPAVYRAFRDNVVSMNLTPMQLAALGWRARQIVPAAVPPIDTRTIGGVSYVIPDWDTGRQIWETAIR